MIDFTINIASVANKSYPQKQSFANSSFVILSIEKTQAFCIMLCIFVPSDLYTCRVLFLIHQQFTTLKGLTPYMYCESWEKSNWVEDWGKAMTNFLWVQSWSNYCQKRKLFKKINGSWCHGTLCVSCDPGIPCVSWNPGRSTTYLAPCGWLWKSSRKWFRSLCPVTQMDRFGHCDYLGSHPEEGLEPYHYLKIHQPWNLCESKIYYFLAFLDMSKRTHLTDAITQL